MTSSRVGARTLAASAIAFGLGLGSATIAFADPSHMEPKPPAPGTPSAGASPIGAPAPGPPSAGAPAQGNGAEPAKTACRRFASAWRVSSSYYNKFAYGIAGNGAHVEYQDPTVRSNNVDGRTALRKAAAEALSASGTPGLAPALSDPMRSWSMNAAKLVVIMGLRGNGNSLNDAATELNEEAEDVQMACADAGVQAAPRGRQGQGQGQGQDESSQDEA